ncbi:MAG: SDR family oxidoreductase [Verrucomicrobiales bacterium]
MRLSDKVIVVTGSTTGIGKAIAKKCLAEGASVMIHGLEPDLAKETRNELDPDHGKSGIVIVDLLDPDSPGRIREAVMERFGTVHGLVNNAGLVGTGDLFSTDAERFDRFLAVNAKAPFLLVQAFVGDLQATAGSVVNIGSVNAYCGEPDLLPYSMSKGALMTMTRNLGDTLHRERGVRVNQINPGWILTENEDQRKQDQGLPENWAGMLDRFFAPAGRILDPSEVAAAVVYFLSEESGPVSGSVLDLEQYPMIGRNPAKEI